MSRNRTGHPWCRPIITYCAHFIHSLHSFVYHIVGLKHINMYIKMYIKTYISTITTVFPCNVFLLCSTVQKRSEEKKKNLSPLWFWVLFCFLNQHLYTSVCTILIVVVATKPFFLFLFFLLLTHNISFYSSIVFSTTRLAIRFYPAISVKPSGTVENGRVYIFE